MTWAYKKIKEIAAQAYAMERSVFCGSADFINEKNKYLHKSAFEIFRKLF
jgi:hypothetical protein